MGEPFSQKYAGTAEPFEFSPAEPVDYGRFSVRYNTIRPHWALIPQEGGDPMTPHDVYVEGKATAIATWQGWAKAAKKKLDELMTEEAA